MSIPEPNPINKGVNVPDILIEWLEKRDNSKEIIQLIKERDEFGYKKYGQHLTSQDGRNTVEDARQELGDLMQYIMKAKINGENLEQIKTIIPHLINLLDLQFSSI